MTCRSDDGRHRNPSPSHAAGAWCNDCGEFVMIDAFVEPLAWPKDTYLIDGRDPRIPEELRVTWDGDRKTWRHGQP